MQIFFYGANHIPCGRHFLTAGNSQLWRHLNRLFADIPMVFFITIANQLASRLPATAVGTTREHSNGAEELMMGIRFPVWRFPPTCDDNTRSMAGLTGAGFHGCSEVHGKRDRADDPFGIMHQPYELPKRRLSDEIGDACQ